MSEHRSHLRAVRLFFLMGLLVTAVPIPAQAATDHLPDLKMSYPRAFSVDTTTIGGHRLLRFTTIIANVGAGPFEVRGQRPGTSTSTMSVDQVVYDTSGGSRQVATSGVMLYDVGDGHRHWHLRGLAQYDLLRTDGSRVAASPKIGFCFYDGVAYNLNLPGAPQSAVYPQSGCGTTSSLHVRMGLSVGWADKYRYRVANQWIDITGVSDGRYRVRVAADASNYFLESNDGNNGNYADIRIQGTNVTVLARGPN
jgi:Lysyl oxidase